MPNDVLVPVLKDLVTVKELKLMGEKRSVSLNILRQQAETAGNHNNFLDAFPANEVNIIAEVKFSSPSEKKIYPASVENAVDVAGQYLANGAKAISVLTESEYFHGSYDYLSAIREKYPEARLLMKDFIFEPYQIYKAKVIGADAILLIVSILTEAELAEYLDLAHSLNLTVLVEVHDENEMKIALKSGAKLIGVNNRNLKTMEVSLSTSKELSKYLTEGMTFISESGIKKLDEINELREHGYQGFLIGSAMMKSGKPGNYLQKMLAG